MTTMSKRKKKGDKFVADSEREALKAALAAARGSLAWVPYSVDDFLRDKHKEVERENQE